MTDQPGYHRNSIWNQDPRADEVLKESYRAKCSFSVISDKIYEWTGLRLTRSAIAGKINRLRREGAEGFEPRPEDFKHHSRLKPGFEKKPRVWKPKVIGAATEPEIMQPTPPDFLGLTFADLDIGPIPRFCRYPQGGDGSPILYCGQPVKEGSSYCPWCHSIAWHKAKTYRVAAEYGPIARKIR